MGERNTKRSVSSCHRANRRELEQRPWQRSPMQVFAAQLLICVFCMKPAPNRTRAGGETALGRGRLSEWQSRTYLSNEIRGSGDTRLPRAVSYLRLTDSSPV